MNAAMRVGNGSSTERGSGALRPLLTSASFALLLAVPAPALAKVLNVTSLSNSGPGTLRQSIIIADPGDEIVVPQGTIALTSGQLVISKRLTIRGAGRDLTIVDGSGQSRSFFVTSAASGVAISGLRIRNGDVGLDNGGGIKNDGNLTLRDVAIAGNQAITGGGIFNTGTLVVSDAVLTGNHSSIGGGIASIGAATITRCTISGNDAEHFGGGVEVGAGAMTISRSAVLANVSRAGAGVDINAGMAVVEDTVIDGNTASDTGGGGIMNSDRLILIGSRVTGNRVPVRARFGGGLFNKGIAFVSGTVFEGNEASTGGGITNDATGELTIANSTIDRNAADDAGGGINNAGELDVTNATFSANTAVSGGAIRNESSGATRLDNVTVVGTQSVQGGGLSNLSGQLSIQNTVIANSLPGANCTGSIVSGGHNLSSDNSCGLNASGDQSNTDPKLGPLQDNGGPTPTHALQSGSPAIDTADPATCPSTDQRGFRRESSHCAKGAFQNVAVATALVGAVTPDTRSGTVGHDVTAFLTAINVGSTNAHLCGISPLAVGPYTFAFQTTNPQNQLIGTPNQPVDIGPGQAQSFVIVVTPTAAFPRVGIPLSIACANSTPAPIVAGVNRVSLAASAAPIPDPVVITLTPSNDGILRLDAAAGRGFFVAATVNVGAAGIMTASVDAGGVPAAFILCKTDPVTSACLGPPAAQVTSPMAANETATYGIFGVGLAIPFDPAQNRVTFSLEGGGGKGAASVAVCRDPSCP